MTDRRRPSQVGDQVAVSVDEDGGLGAHSVGVLFGGSTSSANSHIAPTEASATTATRSAFSITPWSMLTAGRVGNTFSISAARRRARRRVDALESPGELGEMLSEQARHLARAKEEHAAIPEMATRGKRTFRRERDPVSR